MFDFLQVVDTIQQVAGTVANADKNQDGSISFFEVIFMGGWIMLPLALMLLAVIYVFVERYIAIKHASRIDQNFMSIIRDHIVTGNIQAARSFAKNTNNPVARIIDKGIQRIGKPIEAIERSMDNVGQLEMYKLEKNLGVLSLVSKAAPIFGFVGTLIGMMQLFSDIQNAGGEIDLIVISHGIYTKLITSITGLVIGLVGYMSYSYLNTQIDKTANKMELASSDFLDVLQEPTR